jgi:hypothetical protein
LPNTVFAAGEVVAALRTVQQAGYVGKLVVNFALPKPTVLRSDSSYLITGGLGGLGSADCRGAGRSGSKATGAGWPLRRTHARAA